MSVILDTGILYAYYDRSDAWHRRALGVVHADEGGLVLPAPVIPEVDYLVGRRLGVRARRMFYRGIYEGYFLVADLPAQGYRRVAEIDSEFSALDLGFVDAAVVAIAETLNILRVATTDRRDFEPLVKPLGLELLP